MRTIADREGGVKAPGVGECMLFQAISEFFSACDRCESIRDDARRDREVAAEAEVYHD